MHGPGEGTFLRTANWVTKGCLVVAAIGIVVAIVAVFVVRWLFSI